MEGDEERDGTSEAPREAGYRRRVTNQPAPTSATPTGTGAPDLFTWEFATDPYPAYAWLREHAPVHRTRLPSGVEAWLVTRYADAKQALADRRLSQEPGASRRARARQGEDRYPR